MNDAKRREAAAKAAHEVNRVYCNALGDYSQDHWENAPPWQRDSARSGVSGVLAGNTPEQQHAQWMEEKLAAGWKYGPTTKTLRKTHHCLVPYAELPPEQQEKDRIYLAVVGAFLGK